MERDVREIRATALGAGIVALYALIVLASGKVDPAAFANLWRIYIKAAVALWVVLGLLGLLVLLVRQRPRGGVRAPSPFVVIQRWLADRWRRDLWLSLLWPPLLFASLIASFNAFKQMILIGAGFRYDPLFAELDRLLFLGRDPWLVTHQLFGSPIVTWLIDKAYHGWFVPMSLGVILCAWLSRESYRLRTQYLLSYILVWIGIGSLLAWLLPAAGPCFYPMFEGASPGFQALLDKLAADQEAVRQIVAGGKLDALNNQAGLLKLYGSDRLAIGGGISAMPSVHNALAVLFALAAFRMNRKAGWFMAGYAVLIWIGSIHLGWHYAIDGIVAAVLTIGIWHATGWIADRLERPILPRRAPELAPAE